MTSGRIKRIFIYGLEFGRKGGKGIGVFTIGVFGRGGKEEWMFVVDVEKRLVNFGERSWYVSQEYCLVILK